MSTSPPAPVLPIVIVSLEGGKPEGEDRSERFRLCLATDAVGERTTARLKRNARVNHLLTQQSEKCECGREGFPSTKIQFG